MINPNIFRLAYGEENKLTDIFQAKAGNFILQMFKLANCSRKESLKKVVRFDSLKKQQSLWVIYKMNAKN